MYITILLSAISTVASYFDESKFPCYKNQISLLKTKISYFWSNQGRFDRNLGLANPRVVQGASLAQIPFLVLLIVEQTLLPISKKINEYVNKAIKI